MGTPANPDGQQPKSNGVPTAILLGAAFLLIALYAAFLGILYFSADDRQMTEIIWSRRTYLLAGAEAIVFVAAGWLFGKEVHRKEAEKATAAEAGAKADAAEAKQKGEDLRTAILTNPTMT